MEQLARTILETVELYNASELEAQKRNDKQAAMTIEQAADKAACGAGYDTRGTEPIRLLLEHSWDESIDWAKKCLKPDPNRTSSVDDIIEVKCYRGIRDQDGWETLELTVRANHDDTTADLIMEELNIG